MKQNNRYLVWFYLTVACATLSIGSVCAQKMVIEKMKFSGVVINSQTTLPMPDVHCRYAGMIETTDSRGQFEMFIDPGDSVLFSYVGFRPYRVVIPDSLDKTEYVIGVFLSPDTVELAEVLILRRFGEQARVNRINAQNNISGVVRDAYAPVKSLDGDANQRRLLDEFSAKIADRGHVTVGLGVGTNTADYFFQRKMARKFSGERRFLEVEEVDLLKKLYYLEKTKKPTN